MTPHSPARSLTVLGATGSIGASTLKIIDAYPQDLTLDTLTAQENVHQLIELAQRYRPRHVVIGNPAHHATLRDALVGMHISVAAGAHALAEAAARPVDRVVAAIVGVAGLRPVVAAIEAGNAVALANKETLVAAGEIIMKLAAKHAVTLYPVDSEHNAIFQIFQSLKPNAAVEKVTLTASGGPLRTAPLHSLAQVTPAQAVAHPNWSMGAKISVDSATMMNKGLELIEAMHLFALPPEKLDALIHPQSIVHGLVHYRDGSVLAQLGIPDMVTPIAYCLSFPQRLELPVRSLDLTQMHQLSFEPIDTQRFPCFALAKEAMRLGGAMPAILNAANEVAVDAFLKEKISFTQIAQHNGSLMQHYQRTSTPRCTTIEDVLALDEEVRNQLPSKNPII